MGRVKSRKGWIRVGSKEYYVKSSWEANMALYYQLLKKNGDICDWEYEPDTFWFERIRRGVRSYTPDFKIWISEEDFYYVEVKGYMDSKSKTKIKRMKKYFPQVELRVITKKEYNTISKVKRVIPEWDRLV